MDLLSMARFIVTLPRSRVMTEGLKMVTLPTRLEPSGRTSDVPARILTSVMLRPASLFKPSILN